MSRKIVAVQTDVMGTEQVRMAVERADKEFGRLDILVNTLAVSAAARSSTRTTKLASAHRHQSRQHVCRGLSCRSRGAQGGLIVNASSIEGARAAPNFAACAACTARMLSFTRTMAPELAADGMRVDAISPDQTTTPGNHGQRTGPIGEPGFLLREPALQDAMDRCIPVGREATCPNAVRRPRSCARCWRLMPPARRCLSTVERGPRRDGRAEPTGRGTWVTIPSA